MADSSEEAIQLQAWEEGINNETKVAQLQEEEDQESEQPEENMSMPEEENYSEVPQENDTDDSTDTIYMEPIYIFTYQGVTHAQTETEYEAFKSGVIHQLNRNEVLQMRLRVGSARSLWDYFTEINDD